MRARTALPPSAPRATPARRRLRALPCWVLAVWTVLGTAPGVAPACSEEGIAADLRVLSGSLDERARSALARIDGLGRQLLAARSYLRAGEALPTRWSWTGEEVDAYERSREYRSLRAEISKVTRRFEESNPGYTLYVNLEARSLDLQLERWNDNASVKSAADAIRKAALENRCLAPNGGDPAHHEPTRLRSFLIDFKPSIVPALAAPGLSLHGQLRAFDFQVKRGSRIVAGPYAVSIESVWTGQGWTDKLRDAVRSASTSLQGPLESPDEPWHYVYEP